MTVSNQSAASVEESQVTQVDKSEVGNRARKGVKWTALQIIARNVLSLGTTAVLARLLSPGDFGLVGMVATLTALLQVFSDMGLSWATIQRKELSNFQVSNLFWINTCVGSVLWLICAFGAQSVADFYNQSELVGITIALGAGFFLSGLSAQPIALLNRSMNYKSVAQVEVCAMLAGATSALLAAIYGVGYWALVIQSLVNQGTRALLSIPISRIQLFAPKRGIGTQDLVSFGGLLAVNGLLIYLARNLDSVLVGKYWGIEELGYYNRAYFLMLLPSMLATGVLTNLMVPSLSALQNDIERFGSAYRRALRMIAFIGCPMALGLALTADEMVQLVYGDKWQAVVPMLIWLSIASVTQPLYNTTGWLFTAAGKAKAYLRLTVTSGLVLVVTFFIALPGGALGIAKGYGLVMGVVIFFPAMWLAHKVAGISLYRSLNSIFPVFICLVCMAVSVKSMDHLMTSIELTWRLKLALKIAIGVFSYALLALIFMREFIKEECLPMLKKRGS
ncbi:lipopolysaccharide biosynthesis protein [Vibrio sp. EJY3]|uniref:lipopolysaccharide biosynthesis protein n=1 Tax=Vibrio sp. (strain EJY3) TaxID=1116375 RepID=UPI000243A5CF|nr:lipopolysaccharide biosynthesis protein [Vibrio sp. EJY3]AEX20719.1 polysaccharide biosynthesis protein [Vibrio sp. EJY3]